MIYISIPDETQQEGYRGHQHAFVYPGLFYLDNFRRFLKQMYLKILFHREIKNIKTPCRKYESEENDGYVNEDPIHHFFICENFEIKQDALELVALDRKEKELEYHQHEA